MLVGVLMGAVSTGEVGMTGVGNSIGANMGTEFRVVAGPCAGTTTGSALVGAVGI